MTRIKLNPLIPEHKFLLDTGKWVAKLLVLNAVVFLIITIVMFNYIKIWPKDQIYYWYSWYLESTISMWFLLVLLTVFVITYEIPEEHEDDDSRI